MLLVFYLLSFFCFSVFPFVSGLFLYRLCIGIPSSTRAPLF